MRSPRYTIKRAVMARDVDLTATSAVDAIGNGNVQAGVDDIDEPTKTDGVMLVRVVSRHLSR